MKRFLGILAVLSLGAGCSESGSPAQSGPTANLVAPGTPTTPATPGTPTTPVTPSNVASPDASGAVAEVGGAPIARSALENILVKSYGLNTLLELVQLEVAKQMAVEAHVTVSPGEIANETDLSVQSLVPPDTSKEDYPSVIQQLLKSQHLTRTDFDLWIETNAYLRKIAKPLADAWINDDKLHEAFNVTYGEQVQVRHIQFRHLQTAAEIKQRLAGGESFQQVAQELSENERTKDLGGELPAFSRNDSNLPEAFKDAAFALKEGQVSDIVQTEGVYHIIKLEKRISPKIVKFDDVKDSLRDDLVGKYVQFQMQALRGKATERVRKSLKINDADLRKQYDDQINAAAAQAKEQGKADLNRELREKFQEGAKVKALTQNPPATAPSDQPPATESVSPALPDTSAPVSPAPPK